MLTGFELVFGSVMVLMMFIYMGIIMAFTLGLVRAGKSCPDAAGRLDKASAGKPVLFVSVIIPVRNETGNIRGILEEMRRQDYPADLMEILVTDDFSEDDTLEVAGRFAKEFPGFPLVLIPADSPDLNGPGKKRAVARAVNLARGKIILCTDADTSRGPGWISSMAGCFVHADTQMVLGPVVLDRGNNLLQKIQAIEFMGIMGTTAGSAELGCPVMCNGASLAYRRTAFVKTGGYGSNVQFASGDDQFLMAAVRKMYGKQSVVFNLDPAAVVSTRPEGTLKGFLNQRIRWVSKSRGYNDPVVIGVGMVTWFVHVFLLSGLAAGMLFPRILWLSLGLWIVKMMAEFPMVWIMNRFFGKRKLLRYYLAAQAFQLVYVALAGMLGLFLPYRWKGRKH